MYNGFKYKIKKLSSFYVCYGFSLVICVRNFKVPSTRIPWLMMWMCGLKREKISANGEMEERLSIVWQSFLILPSLLTKPIIWPPVSPISPNRSKAGEKPNDTVSPCVWGLQDFGPVVFGENGTYRAENLPAKSQQHQVVSQDGS